MKRYNVGNPSGVGVTLQRYAGPRRVDQGEFRYYAGPVKVRAPGTCVQWGGGARSGIHSAERLGALRLT
jgi:hypothetical protein